MSRNLAFNNRMDIFETRRRRLEVLIREVSGGNQAEFAGLMSIKAPQINRWLSTTAADRRNITEPSARKIEEKAGKSKGWLDVDNYDIGQLQPLVVEENEPPAYIEFNANIRAVIAIMKRLGTKEQEKIVFAAHLVEAEANKNLQNHPKRAGQ